MPRQFDVYPKPGKQNRAMPFVVVVQSNRFLASSRSVVVPLLNAEMFRQPDRDVGPHFVVEGTKVVLDPLQITNVPARVLEPVVASLEADDDRIVNAMDALLSRAGA